MYRLVCYEAVPGCHDAGPSSYHRLHTAKEERLLGVQKLRFPPPWRQDGLRTRIGFDGGAVVDACLGVADGLFVLVSPGKLMGSVTGLVVNGEHDNTCLVSVWRGCCLCFDTPCPGVGALQIRRLALGARDVCASILVLAASISPVLVIPLQEKSIGVLRASSFTPRYSYTNTTSTLAFMDLYDGRGRHRLRSRGEIYEEVLFSARSWELRHRWILLTSGAGSSG